jgi:hypothetical protein
MAAASPECEAAVIISTKVFASKNGFDLIFYGKYPCLLKTSK